MDPQNPVPVQPNAPVPSKNVWFDKKHIIMYAIVVFGLALIVGAVYGYEQYVNKPNTTNQEAVNTNPPTQTDPTADWKTYANSQYGFELKIPPTWKEIDYSAANKLSKPQEFGYYDPATSYQFEGSPVYPSIDITVGLDSYSGSITNYEKDSPSSSLLTRQTIAIDGKTAYEYTGTINSIPQDYIALFSNGNFIFLGDNASVFVPIGKTEAVTETNQVFKGMISTFKFTDTTAVDTSTWKTYTNSQYGFSFMYPSNYSESTSEHTAWAPFIESSYAKIVVNANENFGSKDYADYWVSHPGSKTIQINGLDVIERPVGSDMDQENEYQFDFISKGYSVLFLTKSTDKLNEFNQILSTFQFTK